MYTYLYNFIDVIKSCVFTMSADNSIPALFMYGQSYPNPFNPMCNLQFSMYNAGQVKLAVYDIQGREAQTLVNEKLSAGTYEVTFDGSILQGGGLFLQTYNRELYRNQKTNIT
jgi:hypothetical protein